MNKKMTIGAMALVLAGGILGGIVGHAIGGSGTGSDQAVPAENDGRILSNGDDRVYFPLNASGETYGRGDLAVVPDLVLATGDDGTEGYVRDAELLSGRGDVPLYDSDGETIIGTFTLVASGPSVPGWSERLVLDRGNYFASRLGVSEIHFVSSDEETGWVVVHTSEPVEELGARSLQSIDGIVVRVVGGWGPLELQQGPQSALA